MASKEKKAVALTGEQKAAALLISLGPELAAKVYQHLKEETVEQVTLQIANLRKISPEEKDSVMQEVLNIAAAQEYISQGGVEYANLRKISPEEKDSVMQEVLNI